MPQESIAWGRCHLIGADVTLHFARKIVSRPPCVIMKIGPENQRCDYAAELTFTGHIGIAEKMILASFIPYCII